MAVFGELFQSGDWSTEKHVPAIEARSGEGGVTEVVVTVGREIPHPNTTAHHIVWMEVYFLPDGSRFPYQVARIDLSSHGASAQGPDTSGIYTLPVAHISFRREGPGTLFAAAYCNIHGLWQNSIAVK